jgi:hypothetical protein
MKKSYLYFIFLFLFGSSWTACQSNNQKTSQVQDSLLALNSSDSSILTYADGLNKLKESLLNIESPVYTQGDYSFYTSIYKKDSLPVLYIEYGESGSNSFSEKKYYLENGALVLFYEKSKQATSGEKPEIEFKEVRIFFRNDVFLKAEERIAKSDVALNQTPFLLIDEHLVDKNKQIDFNRLEDANKEIGDFNLTFDRIDSLSPNRKYLIMANKNANTYESKYQILKADSLIFKIQENPNEFKGKKLKISHSKQGIKMIYKSGELGL